MSWDLSVLLAELHKDIQQRLERARGSFGHAVTKGDASESVWVELLDTYLPKRYQVMKAHVVDSDGTFSEQMDVVVFDRQYSPFIFRFGGQAIIPAESVYAVFEAKQVADRENVLYAQQKVTSVRRLRRTSLPIPYVEGTYKPKPLIPIIGGLLAFESAWNPPLGESLRSALNADLRDGRLNIGCIAANGHFAFDDGTGDYDLISERKPAAAFLFRLIGQLQTSGTVPMIDINAYARWLTE